MLSQHACREDNTLNTHHQKHAASGALSAEPKRAAMREDVLRLVLAIALLVCGTQMVLRGGIALGLITAGRLLPEAPAGAGAAALRGSPGPRCPECGVRFRRDACRDDG